MYVLSVSVCICSMWYVCMCAWYVYCVVCGGDVYYDMCVVCAYFVMCVVRGMCDVCVYVYGSVSVCVCALFFS